MVTKKINSFFILSSFMFMNKKLHIRECKITINFRNKKAFFVTLQNRRQKYLQHKHYTNCKITIYENPTRRTYTHCCIRPRIQQSAGDGTGSGRQRFANTGHNRTWPEHRRHMPPAILQKYALCATTNVRHTVADGVRDEHSRHPGTSRHTRRLYAPS